jgi:hypothetical protein
MVVGDKFSSQQAKPWGRQHCASQSCDLLYDRLAGMLSPRDAALLEAYARECEDRARAVSIEGAGANTRLSVDIQRRDDQSLDR